MTDSPITDADPQASSDSLFSDSRPDRGRRASAFDADLIPQMGAESEFELIEESAAPVRSSAFVCLVLGVLSFSATVGRPMLALPVLTLLVGLFALRRHDGPKPVGLWAAKLGIVLACGFGAFGLAQPYLKHRTLGKQAEYFSLQLLKLAEQQEMPMVLELQRDHRNRNLESTPLDKFYEDYGETKETAESFDRLEGGPYGTIGGLSKPPRWEHVSTRVFHKYNDEKADVLWRDASGQLNEQVQIRMVWKTDKEGHGHWKVELFQFKRERLVAESVL